MVNEFLLEALITLRARSLVALRVGRPFTHK